MYKSVMRIDRLFVATSWLLIAQACGGSNGAPPATRPPEPVIVGDTPRPAASGPSGKGSSDGTTCEQARDAYVEEINVAARGQADLSADDFAAVLNKGTYLEPCAVPNTSKLRVCAAVQNGQAIGVTVTADPAAPDVEICVAKEVRKLAFPTHVKLDVVNVQF
jgi:hypothetical protein